MLDRTDGRILAGDWTASRIDDLRRMVAEGLSARQIAGELGVSRNAICGKIHRCGFKGPAKEIRTTNPLGGRIAQWPPMTREEKARRQKERALLREITQPQPLPKAQPHLGSLNLTFDQLHSGACRYPIGDGAPFLFCGQPIARDSYCRHCFRVTHR